MEEEVGKFIGLTKLFNIFIQKPQLYPKITSPIPQEIQLLLNNLNLDLDQKISAKRLDKNLLIAT